MTDRCDQCKRYRAALEKAEAALVVLCNTSSGKRGSLANRTYDVVREALGREKSGGTIAEYRL